MSTTSRKYCEPEQYYDSEGFELRMDDMDPMPLDGESSPVTWDLKLGNAMDRMLRRIFVCLGLLDP